MKKPRKRLSLEHLEDRLTPSVFGVSWPDPGHITLSFAPDGTAVGSQSSNLFSKFGTSSAWQREVLRAFQTWAVNADLNIGLVPDGGQGFGTPGAPQGDTRFGDVRIGAAKLPAGTLATNAPFQWTGTTWSGDVLFNTSYKFSTSGAGSYQIFSVLLNEAGNVLGLPDNTDPTSALYDYYMGVRTGLSTGDVAAIKGLYGARSPDFYDSWSPNETAATATSLYLFGGKTEVWGDVTTLTDKDYYQFRTPSSNTTRLAIEVKTAGISLLAPRLQVLDNTGREVASAVTTDPLTGSVRVTLSNYVVDQNYTIHVNSGATNVFGIGAYRLTVGPEGTTPTSNWWSQIYYQDDNRSNETVGTAQYLFPITGYTEGRIDYAVAGRIRDGADVDFYRVTAPKTTDGAPQQLVAMAWAAGTSTLAPYVDVYNAKGQRVAADLVTNQAGLFSIVVPKTTPGETYFLAIGSQATTGEKSQGEYWLRADFNQCPPLTAQVAMSETLTASQSYQQRTLKVGRNQLVQFELAVQSEVADVMVGMTILDAKGNTVATLCTEARGRATSVAVYLAEGSYTVQFTAIAPSGSITKPVNFQLYSLLLSDPIGPTATDPNAVPALDPSVLSWSGPSYSTSQLSPSYMDPFYF